MRVVFYGLEGEVYHSFEQAWDAFFNAVHKEGVSSEQYHDLHMSFMCGAMGALNVLSTRLSNGEKITERKMALDLTHTINEALKAAQDAWLTKEKRDAN